MLVGYVRFLGLGQAVHCVAARCLAGGGVDDRHLFEDRASGARDDRPGLAEALEFVRAGDCLVVWKLDRLGRSLSHLLAIVTGLREKGVGFRSLTEQMDTTTPHGELLFHLFGALAQYERALIQERVKAGIDAAKRRGRYSGRPRTLDGEKIGVSDRGPGKWYQQGGGLPEFWHSAAPSLITSRGPGWTGPK